MASERELLAELDRWLAENPEKGSLVDIIGTGNLRLIGAYILKGFRRATALAGEDDARVSWVRSAIVEAYEGDCAKAEEFLRNPHPLLGGNTPLRKAAGSRQDAEEVIALAGLDVVGASFRALKGIAEAWGLTKAEQARLLGLSPAALERWQASLPSRVPGNVLERLSLIFGIFKAINTLLPVPERADMWIRKPNAAPLFDGRSALDLMLTGAEGLRQVRGYLESQI